MAHPDDRPAAGGTVIDPRFAQRRLKQGLVPPDTGIYLRVEEGSPHGMVYTLSAGGVYVLGREGADIEIPDGKVSRKHAELGLYGPGAYVLRDLASTNGTWVNSRPVGEKVKLHHWDLIRVGDTQLRFAIVDGSIPLGA
jgi:pSer/pThr/pTyr-binding forkhead associated (FHA) protein